MRLRVLDEVTWDGSPVPGERTHALLRALAGAGSRGIGEQGLIEEIWRDDLPANPTKALQVVVSRARSATEPTAIERTAAGYRLALPAEQVDAWALRPLGLRLAAEGEYAEALPLLERATPDDEVTAALLRATAAVHGVPAALDRYEEMRARLADRLGVDPSPALRALHRELLASDRPVRSGVRHYASSLIGRDRDLAELRGLLREHRVVSILGPGGLGKTRLAQLVAASAEQPVVHVVELVGVVDPDDVVGEVGSALGVRDSVSGRRVLTPEQRRDVRTRIAQQLAQTPTLLVLDNCEHLIEAVADLVAFLVVSAPHLRVLTTTRTPLAIGAERVFALGTLGPDDAAALFRERALAARPGVSLPERHVASIVSHLDGLPLAVELAAVKVRAMSVADVDVRLENRFALLRGGDRSAPDRHQTLLAVIDWSWNLLGPEEQRALRWLSVFHDGFSSDAAEEMLGEHAFRAVERLVDSSLLIVADEPGGVRYRMLETVREFGRMQLVDAGEDEQASLAHRHWAVGFCRVLGAALMGPEQPQVVDRIRPEDANLTDVLRQAIAAGDVASAIRVYATLGGYWAIVGDHPRGFGMAGALTHLLAEWDPPEELVEPTRVVLAICMLAANLVGGSDRETVLRAIERVGTGSRIPELATVLRITARSGESAEDLRDAVGELTRDPDRRVRATAYQFLTHAEENLGDPVAAIRSAETALSLVGDELGPWPRGSLHAQLCGLHSQMGDLAGAALHAEDALQVVERLGAVDDLVQLRAVVAQAALAAGDLAQAERTLGEIEALEVPGPFGSRAAVLGLRAELHLAHHRPDEALRCCRGTVEVLRAVRFNDSPEDAALLPWAIASEATALAAYARYAEGDAGADLYGELSGKAGAALRDERPVLDFPVCGMLLFGCGLWALCRGVLPAADAVRLLALADRFGYVRHFSWMAWDGAVATAERAAPGVLGSVEDEYAGRRGAELLDDARRLVRRLW